MMEPMARTGRPSLKNNPLVVEKVMQLAKEGKTQQQIADIIGVDKSTLTYWKYRDWEFSATLNENKQLADQLVEASLFKKALGFTQKVTTEKATPIGVMKVEEEIYIPPSDTAAIFWLKNRQPKEWRDRQEQDHRILMVKQEIVSKLSTEDVVAETERLLAKLKELKAAKVIDQDE